MNEISGPIRIEHKTTQAAEGLPRLAWTLAEFEKLSELGFFGGVDHERERLELIEGELVPMHAKGGRHEWVRGKLLQALFRRLPAGFEIYPEPGWRPGGELYLEPDFILCKEVKEPSEIPPGHVSLIIEVADSSKSYDLATKARIYATLGVREYWVVNAVTLETTVHLKPEGEVYGEIVTFAPDQKLVPHLVPALAVVMGELEIR